jgi:hypothetical protein
VRLRKGYRDVSALLLWFAPYPLIGMQAYGGEMLFRVFLFSLPFQAFFAAALLYPTRADGRGWRTALAAITVSFGLLFAFLFAYFGNERVNYMHSEDMAAADWVYNNAPDGALVLVGSFNGPWQYRDQGRIRSTAITELPWVRDGEYGPVNLDKLEDYLQSRPDPTAYILITRSQKEQDVLMGTFPRGAFAAFEQQLTGSPTFAVAFQNREAKVFRYLRPGGPR